MHSLSFDVGLEGEETLLAGPGLKNLEFCSQADVLAFYSRLNVHSIDLSSHVGAFG